MKPIIQSFLLSIAIVVSSRAQGTFILGNYTALTRVGSIDGPFAGPGSWGQALGGFTTNSLTPVGPGVEHAPGGILSFFPTIILPWADVGQTIFVQMVVWDGTAWGTDLANVPPMQLGHTDFIPMFLTSPTASPALTPFNWPAVVPAVPEPSTVVLVCFGGLGVALFGRRLFR